MRGEPKEPSVVGEHDIDVKDWGAGGFHCDLTGITTAIQNAIDFCMAQGGGKVFFPWQLPHYVPGQIDASEYTITNAAGRGED